MEIRSKSLGRIDNGALSGAGHVTDIEYAIFNALAAVAWADGELDEREKSSIDAMIARLLLGENEAHAVRAYAHEPRALEDIPTGKLSHEQRLTLLEYALVLSRVDGNLSAEEREVLEALQRKLSIRDDEADALNRSFEAESGAAIAE